MGTTEKQISNLVSTLAITAGLTASKSAAIAAGQLRSIENELCKQKLHLEKKFGTLDEIENMEIAIENIRTAIKYLNL